MKYLILSALISTSAFALKLERHQSPGYVVPAYRIATHCVAEDGIVKITKDFFHHGVQTVESKEFKITDEARLIDQLKKAAAGLITETAGPVDGPSIVYTATNNQGEEILLKHLNGGSGVFRVNEAQEARELVFLIDNLCEAKSADR